MFALSPTKTFNPPSVASGQQEDSQHNTSGISSLFRSIPTILQYQQFAGMIDTPQPFSPSQLQPAPSPVPTTTQDLPASSASRNRPNQQISLHLHQKGPYKGYPNIRKFKAIIQLLVLPKNKTKHTVQHLHFPQIHNKNCVNE